MRGTGRWRETKKEDRERERERKRKRERERPTFPNFLTEILGFVAFKRRVPHDEVTTNAESERECAVVSSAWWRDW